MQTPLQASDGRRLTGGTAVLAGLLAWACAGFYAAATGGDFGMVQRPSEFLAQPTEAIDHFHLAMLLDCLGFYLPFLIIGAYLWSQLRAEHGVTMDMALLCILVYVILGVAGAAIQLAALHPLVAAHSLGDPVTQAASQSAWLAVAHAAHGLWAFEGPVMGFWGWFVGRALHRAGRPYGRLLMLVGICYVAAFISYALALSKVFELVQLFFILLLPL